MFKSYLFCFLVILNLNGLSQTSDKKDIFSVNNPKYEVYLSVIEFSILNGSMVDGLTKYQGNLEFSLTIRTEGSQIIYDLSSTNKRLFEVLSLYVAQKLVELLKIVDINNPSQNDKVALNAISSLSVKLENALNNPVWEIRKVSGIVKKVGEDFQVTRNENILIITGNKAKELEPFTGKQVILNGYIKEQGKIEVLNFHEKKSNTLELFVMSQCPFGTKAISFVLDKLDQLPPKNKFSLEVHYIFYKKDDVYASLHGEAEVTEDIVQMVIRDLYNQYFFDYLKHRIKEPGLDWKEVARQTKIKEIDISKIKDITEKKRNELIKAEVNYSISNFQHIDASPTYIWESEIVSNPNDIDILKSNQLMDNEKCKGL